MTACAWCGATDRPVASSITADGHRWPPLCSRCSAKVRRAPLRAPRGRDTAQDARKAPEPVSGTDETLWRAS